MGALQPWHLFIVVVALIVLFGSKRLPDAARGIGKSLRIFKAETKGLREDDTTAPAPPPPAAPAPLPPAQAVAPQASQPQSAETGERRAR